MKSRGERVEEEERTSAAASVLGMRRMERQVKKMLLLPCL